MAGILQPLGKEFPIVGEDGRPTEYFIRWAQQRQIDIGEGITAAEALQIVTDYVNQFTTDHQLQEGVGIDISPSGDLKDNPTISLDAVLDDLNDVDTVTTPPTDGQALIWNDTDDLWVPGDVASGGGGGGGALHKIAEFIAVGGETEYVFSGIPQTYDDLVVVTSLRSTGGTGETSSRVHINGDTGTNYGRQRGNFSAGSATAAATDETFAWIGYATGSTGLAGGFDQGSVQFVNYADSVNHKGWLAHSMSKAASSGAYSEILLAGQWENTAPITSLRFHLETGNYAAGSKIIVYGRGGVAGPPVGGALQKIAQFVAIGGETTYTFSSLPQTYDDLVIIHNARGDTAANDTQLDMRFNGDTGSNYNYQQLFANGTATSAVRNNSSSLLRINQFAAASSTANVFTGGVTEVYAYANNVAFKSATGYGGNFDGSNIRSITGAGQWRNTAAITSVTVFPGAGAFVAGSVITVYGRGGPAGAVEGIEVQDEGVVTDPNTLVLNFTGGGVETTQISSGIVEVAVGNGPKAALLQLSASVTGINAAVGYAVALNTTVFDDFSAVSSDHFVVPAGVTRVRVSFTTRLANLNTASGEYIQVAISDSSTPTIFFGANRSFTPTPGNYFSASSTILDVTPGDTFYLFIQGSSGQTNVTIDHTQTWFSIEDCTP
jgi:hypothetical protein